ncbi:MAG: rhomboid family intramembrane serine protease [Candidatus Thalassarchaeaceae archaeon]|nr:rhomboid family intramembrane serine protease [Candidatus Thalassarchaeaceae archaeon]
MSQPLTVLQLTVGDSVWLLLFLAAAIGPYVQSVRSQTPVSLATVLSLMLVSTLQFAHAFVGDLFASEFDPVLFGALIPQLATEPTHIHRMITAGWLHGGAMHVVGNVLVIALVGLPLEGRLGARRWMAVYILGLIGGNLAWWGSHMSSWIPALGASGACFGLLGAYLACWPNDRIAFPLIFLIREWPVGLVAVVRLGFEVYYVYGTQSGSMGSTNVAHLAHIGGFFLCFALGRVIAKGAPIELDDSSTSPYSMGSASTPKISNLDSTHPWTGSEYPLDDKANRVMERLMEEGDEFETRVAWLEELIEVASCPICDSLIQMDKGGHTLQCSTRKDHIHWP